MHHVRIHLDIVEILRECALVPLAFLERMELEHALSHLGLSGPEECQLRNLLHVMHAPARLDATGKLQHRLFAHAVTEIVRAAGNQHGRHQAVIPIVVMGKPAEGSLHAADDDRNVRIQFLQYLCIHGYRPVRPLPEFGFRSICIIVAEPFGCRVVVHHGIHRTGIDPEIKPRSTKLLEIPEVIPPVGLRHNGNAPAPFLKPTRYTGSPERGMVHKSISCKKYDVNVVPA